MQYDHWVVVLDSKMNWLHITYPIAIEWKVWQFITDDKEPIIVTLVLNIYLIFLIAIIE